MVHCILYIAAFLFFAFLAYYGYVQEKKNYCGGSCPKCGRKLRCLEKDSQGCRHYFCDVCGHDVLVTWNKLDKNYSETENEHEDRERPNT